MNILLCDDDPFFLGLEKDAVNQVIRENGFCAQVAASVSSATEAAVFLEKNPGRYLIFLDFDFGPGIPNGLDVSTVLKRQNRQVQIVYTTNHREKALEILKSGTEPFGFLEKGTNFGRLAVELRRYIQMALPRKKEEPEGKRLRLKLGMGETVELRLSDILYVEAEKLISHGITYHTVHGSSMTVLGTLEEERKRLGEGFLRIHRSYLAAKNQIVAFHGSYLTLSDGKELPCSLRMRNEVQRWAGMGH